MFFSVETCFKDFIKHDKGVEQIFNICFNTSFRDYVACKK